MKKLTKYLLTTTTILLITTVAQARDQIRIVGSSTVYPFATVVAEKFGISTKFKTPVVESTGSGGGLKIFCQGIGPSHVDITNSSRRIKAKEIKKCAKNGISEITEVKIPQRQGKLVIVETDEEPQRANFEKMKLLKPVFNQNGTITAANASKINDGAAALLVMTRERANEIGLQVMATIVSQSSSAHAPEWFTTAPIGAISNIFQKESLNADNIDLWEINEAFAVVPMAAIEKFNLNNEKVNVNGGAIALGHPIGASGTRIVVTLIHEMIKRNVKKSLATLCIGGGMGISMCIERD